MKRITPEEVVAAYKETGLKPVTEDFGNAVKNCGCALTALTAMVHPDTEINDIIEAFENDDFPLVSYDRNYLIDFIAGFDESSCDDTQGYQDGHNARKAVSKEFNLGWEV
jgi:hypothetical protein